MRDVLIYALLATCLVALAGLFVAIFGARIGAMEWWLGGEDAEPRPGGRLAFVQSSWFAYAMGGTFAGAALTLMFLLN